MSDDIGQLIERLQRATIASPDEDGMVLVMLALLDEAADALTATNARLAEEREACALIADDYAKALGRKLGRGKILDEVTQGIIDILHLTASFIRARGEP